MFKSKKIYSQRGFTLIEALVVIFIIALITAIAIPNFRSYERNAKVRYAAKELRSLLWDAQGLSLAPEDVDISSYKVSVLKGQTSANPIKIERIGGISGTVSKMILDSDIFIEDVILGNISQDSAITISFLTGNVKGGSFDFSPNPNDRNKLVIRIGSVNSSLKVDVVLDSSTNTVTWNRIP